MAVEDGGRGARRKEKCRKGWVRTEEREDGEGRTEQGRAGQEKGRMGEEVRRGRTDRKMGKVCRGGKDGDKVRSRRGG